MHPQPDYPAESSLERRIALVVLALGVLGLLLLYGDTLQTIPNGSSHYFMIDVGETQAVLNEWGTLHATGYPHYVVVGNLLTGAMRVFGVSGVTAAALVSFGFNALALGLLMLLVYDLTGRTTLAVATMLIFALTRTVWVHAVIAEIYSFGLVFQISLLWLALTPRDIPYRLSLLALVGGLASAHHRGIGLLAPALIIGVWPALWAQLREQPPRALFWLGLGLLGWLPYIYLPLRADATWAYGELATVEGVRAVISGAEFNYLLHWPTSTEELSANTEVFLTVLRADIGVVGMVAGVAALVIGLRAWALRRMMLVLVIAAGVAFFFNTVLYYAILSSLVMTVTVSLLLAIALVMNHSINVLLAYQPAADAAMLRTATLLLSMATIPAILVTANRDIVLDLTTDPTGQTAIAIAANTPPDATFHLAWGPLYFAVGVAQDVQDRYTHFQRVDHRANFAQIVADGRLVTPDYTLFNQPPAWWQDRIGAPVVLRAVGPRLIEIDTAHIYLAAGAVLPANDGRVPVVAQRATVTCGTIPALQVEWVALAQPQRNLSVLVHMLDAEGRVVATADQFAPVYGWRPLPTWQAREIVTDVYPLEERADVVSIRYGFYEQLPSGEFRNYNVRTVPYRCNPDANRGYARPFGG